jgi:tyrosyl-DNA phosphodiesterase 2
MISVATWNVWFGPYQFVPRARALLAELARHRPDVIALQEVTPELLAIIAREPWLRDAYQLSDAAIDGYDVVLLSRQPIRALSALPLPTQMGRRVLVAELACGLAVATVHLESLRDRAEWRATQLQIIMPWLVEMHADAVLVGDMNFAPEDELETAALHAEFVDVWPALHPGDPGFTIDSDINAMRLRASGVAAHRRFDRVFLRSHTWRATSIERLGTSPIDTAGTFASDHFGLLVQLATD